ncbi:MAG TPA: GWxTD domain-containing protein [Thermoanaerobaculia bacterium]|nr:GWxTD domain-containing protein [Thermoanaerobaculia bacterium]
MLRYLAVALLSLVVLPVQAAVDPAAALAEAKSLINARKYSEAVTALEPALQATANMPEGTAKKQEALTALHFYSAVALSGLQRDDEALSHLEAALRYSPNIRGIDRKSYDPRFVSLFDRARGETGGGQRFEAFYPGFSSIVLPPQGDADRWHTPALELLGSKSEKRQWQNILAAAERAKFIEGFWKVRDQKPATEVNEFRDLFARRVAFADKVFGTLSEQGSTTDRGRVFAVLGEPAMVRRRAINRSDPIQSFNVGSVGIDVGTIEYWVYTREQLPVAQRQSTVTFRFVSHQGIGEFVLQKDGLAMNALAAAAASSNRE